MYSSLKELLENVNSTVANRISASRILMLPFFVIYHCLGRYDIAFALAFYMILSDLIDGYIARTNHETSEFGKILDPVADKIVTFGLFITLLISMYYIFGWSVWWPIVRICLLLLAIEIFLLIIGYWAARRGVHSGSNLGGKAKMIVESYIFLYCYCFLFVNQSDNINIIAQSIINLLWFALALALASILLHLCDYYRTRQVPFSDEIKNLIQTMGILWAIFVFVVYLIISGIIDEIREFREERS